MGLEAGIEIRTGHLSRQPIGTHLDHCLEVEELMHSLVEARLEGQREEALGLGADVVLKGEQIQVQEVDLGMGPEEEPGRSTVLHNL